MPALVRKTTAGPANALKSTAKVLLPAPPSSTTRLGPAAVRRTVKASSPGPPLTPSAPVGRRNDVAAEVPFPRRGRDGAAPFSSSTGWSLLGGSWKRRSAADVAV